MKKNRTRSTRKNRKTTVLSALCLGLMLLPTTTVAAPPDEEDTVFEDATGESAGTQTGSGKASGKTTVLDEVVVTASRSETSLAETTKSISVIGSEDRDDQQQYFLPKLMDSEPGVFLQPNGGLGQYSPISIRGAGTQHTQVQYNGTPLRDASDTQSTIQYFIEDLFSNDNLDRVEILKGTNSVLYGSQAMGGVINIIPQKWGVGLKASLRNEFGPNDTYIGNARLAYGADNWYVDFNPTYVTTDGEKYGGPDGYGYRNTGGALSAGFKPTDDTALELNAIYNHMYLASTSDSVHLRNGKLVSPLASKDAYRKSQMSQVGLNWTQKVNETWDYSLKAAFTETMRHYFSDDPKHPDNHSDYDGSNWYFETQQNLHFTDWLTLNIGADYEDSRYKGREPTNTAAEPYDFTPVDTKDSWHSGDIFGQAQLAFLERTLLFNLGARLNMHEKFDEKAVWEVSGAYLLKESGTKFHASVATGYRTPSLYETYGGYMYGGVRYIIGNLNLVPEESTSYEIGVDQSFLDGKIQTGLTWFHIDFDDPLIFSNLAFRYENAPEAETEGIEAWLRLQPWDWMRLNLGYTYVDAKYIDEKTRLWTRRENLPRNKFTATLTLKPLDNLSFAATMRWLDTKILSLTDRADYSSVRWEEGSVATVDLAVSYKPIDHLELFARVDNLFDKDYTSGGYYMPGVTVFGGLKLNY